MDEKKYLLDGNEASARDVIRKAREIDPMFGTDGLLLSSEAADILRGRGYTIGDNPNYKEMEHERI